jgi:concentrative nucleoside transporter, CNT family
MALVQDEANPYVNHGSSVAVSGLEPIKRMSATSYNFSNEKDDITKEKHPVNSDGPEILAPIPNDEAGRNQRHELYLRFRPYILTGIALVILGWWISATILKATRHRWCVVILLVHDR